MSRDVTSAAQSAVQAGNVPLLILAALDFGSGMVRVTNAPYTWSWNGYSWIGLGSLGGIGEPEEAAALQAFGLALKLTGVPLNPDGESEYLSIALGEQYQGRDVTIWAAPLDDNYSVIADPIVVFQGFMDDMDIAFGQTAQISVNARSRMADLERPRVRRYNDGDQQSVYSGDLGLQYVEQMVEKQLIWGRG